MTRFFLVAIVLSAVSTVRAQGPIEFNRDIRPILSDNCFLCHGPDSVKRKAGLRLDTEDGLFGKRDDGPVVVKKDPAKSPLLTRVMTDDASEVMPPPKTNKKLSAAQKETLRRWIEQGAPFENHWSFVKPVRPPVPNVKNKEWVKNPVDAFVLAKLDSLGLTPAPEADRRSLIRRVTLDLTGLPPTPEEVAAFVADKAPDAYEKLVDRLLASDQYGEHRARYWLDAARYGDTHGLHFDNYREMYPYRDWVIRAFNKNQPFDKFTVEQLAGDLLPNRTPDQQVASGFHRCNITTNEGGSINEEVLVSYTRDRVETTATVWLGLTAGCCVCHNHKFDPLSQKEFYQLAAYFRNTTQGAMDGNIPNTPPVISVPSMADKPRHDALQTRVAELKAELQKRQVEGQKSLQEWVKAGGAAKLTEPLDPATQSFVLPIDDKLPAGVVKIDGPVPESNGIRFDGDSGWKIDKVGDFAADKPFTISTWVFAPVAESNYTIANKFANPTEKDKHTGWRLTLNSRILNLSLVGPNPKTETYFQSSGNNRLDGGKWTHVVVTYDGPQQASGLVIYFDGKIVDTVRMTPKDVFKADIRNGSPLLLGASFKDGGLADFRIFDRAVTADEAAILAGWLNLRRELAKDPAQIDPKNATLSLAYANRFGAAYQKASAELTAAENELKQIAKRSPITHVMQDKPGMPTARVLFRGLYDQPRDEVKPGVFAALNPMPKDAPANRLGLAEWIVSPENPLTARVTVNRFWQEVFGVGLVKSAEDFGSQGENPSHPELLDWMAVDFREGGWDVKKFFKMLVTSNTYKQATVTTPEKREKDAHNRYLSRGPRYRMDAEMIRDQALAASGLLVKKIGGPSVRPYQPDGIWESVGLGAGNTNRYVRDKGEGLYRRSMYSFWKRMSPPPSLEVFNAPSRETCTVRRERTNTPLQALVTMNDPQFVEAARILAQNALLAKNVDEDGRLDFVALRLMARPFRDEERKIVHGSLQKFAAFYKANPAEAAKLIAIGDMRADTSVDVPTLAAWTMVANQLMNLDEVLNK